MVACFSHIWNSLLTHVLMSCPVHLPAVERVGWGIQPARLWDGAVLRGCIRPLLAAAAPQTLPCLEPGLLSLLPTLLAAVGHSRTTMDGAALTQFPTLSPSGCLRMSLIPLSAASEELGL